MRYAALSDIRSLHGNQVGAPCGCAATSTPSVSSSHPAWPSGPRIVRGLPRYPTVTRSCEPAGAGARNRILIRLDRYDHRATSAPWRWSEVTPSPCRSSEQVGQLGERPNAQDGVALEVVAEGPVAQVEVVVLDRVPVVAVAGQVGIGSAHSSSSHGPTGLPIHRVLSGTDSPRMTSETGPTVA